MKNNLLPTDNRIFKYQPVDIFSLKNLVSSQIWCSKLNVLNDPYEGNLPFHISEPNTRSEFEKLQSILIDKQMKLEDFINLINHSALNTSGAALVTNRSDTRRINNAGAAAITKSSDMPPINTAGAAIFNDEKLLEQQKISERLNKFTTGPVSFSIKNIKNKYLNNFKHFDILDNAKRKIDRILSEEYKVACFSKKNNIYLMWSHYAQGHRGFCLEFDKNSEPLLNRTEDVIYLPSDKYPIIDMNNIGLEQIRNMWRTKRKYWSYEKEIRLKSDQEELKYPTKALTKIYFGLAMPEEYQLIILKMIKSFKGISVYKIIENDDRSKLQIQRIELKRSKIINSSKGDDIQDFNFE